jgi:hypothetical protein
MIFKMNVFTFSVHSFHCNDKRKFYSTHTSPPARTHTHTLTHTHTHARTHTHTRTHTVIRLDHNQGIQSRNNVRQLLRKPTPEQAVAYPPLSPVILSPDLAKMSKLHAAVGMVSARLNVGFAFLAENTV